MGASLGTGGHIPIGMPEAVEGALLYRKRALRRMVDGAPEHETS